MNVSFFNKNIVENKIITSKVNGFTVNKNLNFGNNSERDEFISNSGSNMNNKNIASEKEVKTDDFFKKYNVTEIKDFFYYLISAYNNLHNNEYINAHIIFVLQDEDKNKKEKLPECAKTTLYNNDKIMQQLHENPNLCYNILSSKDKKTGEPLLLSFSNYPDKNSFYFKIANAFFTTFEDNSEFIKKIIYNIKDSKNENLINKLSSTSLGYLKGLSQDKDFFKYVLLQKEADSNKTHGAAIADYIDSKDYAGDNITEILLFSIYNTFKNEPEQLDKILQLDKHPKLKNFLNNIK